MTNQRFRYASRSDQRKLERIAERLRAIVKRDGHERTFEGVHDYMIRAVIEAMELGDLFYEFPVDKSNP